MRAADRCKQHFQGDRCKKPLHHSSALLLGGKDPVHLGSFTAWRDDSNEIAKAPGAQIIHKRNRQLNRFMRGIGSKKFNPNMVPGSERKPFKFLLDMARRHFGGIQNQ